MFEGEKRRVSFSGVMKVLKAEPVFFDEDLELTGLGRRFEDDLRGQVSLQTAPRRLLQVTQGQIQRPRTFVNRVGDMQITARPDMLFWEEDQNKLVMVEIKMRGEAREYDLLQGLFAYVAASYLYSLEDMEYYLYYGGSEAVAHVWPRVVLHRMESLMNLCQATLAIISAQKMVDTKEIRKKSRGDYQRGLWEMTGPQSAQLAVDWRRRFEESYHSTVREYKNFMTWQTE